MANANQKRNRLLKMKIGCISLVDRPDNPTAEVTFFKRADFEDMENFGDGAESDTSGVMPKKQSAHEGTISKQGALPDGLPDEVEAYIVQLEDLVLKSIDADGDLDLDDDDLEAYDLEGDEGDEDYDEGDGEDDLTDELDDGEEDDDIEKSLESVLKSADPRIVAILKNQQDQLEEVQKTAERERSLRLDGEFAKMASNYSSLGDPRSLSVLLRKAAEGMAPDAFKALKGTLDAAQERLSEGDLFREIGRSHGEFDAGSRLDLVAKAAAAAEGDLSFEQKFAKAIESDKEAYEQYNNEFMGGHK